MVKADGTKYYLQLSKHFKSEACKLLYKHIPTEDEELKKL